MYTSVCILYVPEVLARYVYSNLLYKIGLGHTVCNMYIVHIMYMYMCTMYVCIVYIVRDIVNILHLYM